MPLALFENIRVPVRLCFGTAQLGMDYGAANRDGMPSDAMARALVENALEGGVALFDTAQAYGEAEARLGEMQPMFAAKQAMVITKLAPVARGENETPMQLAARVEGLVYDSLRKLKLTALPVVMLHRVAHLDAYDGVIWRVLKQLADAGVIGALGVSVSTPEEAARALVEPEVRWLQVPFNILDKRLLDARMMTLFNARRDVTVCARSALLQGVLTQPAAQWPVLEPWLASEVAGLLDECVARFGRESRADLACAYVRGQGWLQVLVMGMENMGQLRHNLALFERPPLSAEECDAIAAMIPVLPEAFLNPALWPKKET